MVIRSRPEGDAVKQNEQKPWNPYLAGGLVGLLMVFSAWFTGNYFGASTTFVRAAGKIEQFILPDRVAVVPYFLQHPIVIDWQGMFVIGIFIGSLLSSTTSGTFRIQAVPDTWNGRFGPSLPKRVLAAFAGGAVAMFGARLADG